MDLETVEVLDEIQQKDVIMRLHNEHIKYIGVVRLAIGVLASMSAIIFIAMTTFQISPFNRILLPFLGTFSDFTNF